MPGRSRCESGESGESLSRHFELGPGCFVWRRLHQTHKLTSPTEPHQGWLRGGGYHRRTPGASRETLTVKIWPLAHGLVVSGVCSPVWLEILLNKIPNERSVRSKGLSGCGRGEQPVGSADRADGTGGTGTGWFPDPKGGGSCFEVAFGAWADPAQGGRSSPVGPLRGPPESLGMERVEETAPTEAARFMIDGSQGPRSWLERRAKGT